MIKSAFNWTLDSRESFVLSSSFIAMVAKLLRVEIFSIYLLLK